jgi:hypothetical protein
MEQLNLLANMTDYKQETAEHVPLIEFVTEVLLPGATEKTKVVASVVRDDWHEFGLDDYCSYNANFDYLVYDDGSSSSTTRDRMCNENGAPKYIRTAAGSTYDRYYDYDDNGYKSYSDKWYTVKEYCATKNKHCYIKGLEPASASSSFDCAFGEPYVNNKLFYCDQTDGEWKMDASITTAEQYCDKKLKFNRGWAECSYEAIAAVEHPNECAEDDAGCQQWEYNVFDYTCFVPSGLTWPEGVEPDGQPLVGQCGLYTGGWSWSNGV